MILRYLHAVLRHKWFILLESIRLGVPFLGLIHDASKFRPSEMLPYAGYFYGGASPDDHRYDTDFNVAWNAHQKHNKHHRQYRVLINDRSDPQISALPMPDRYIREMIADWRGAGRAYGNPDTAGWYENIKDKQILHPITRRRVENLLHR